MTFTKVDQARLQELTTWLKAAEATWTAIQAAPDYKYIPNDPREPCLGNERLYDEWLGLDEKKRSAEYCAAYPIGTRVTGVSKAGKPLSGVIVGYRSHTSYPQRLKGNPWPVVQWDGFKRKSLF